MKRVILDSIGGFNWIKRDVFTPGAVIRVLTQDDIVRVGDIVVLKKSGAPEEENVLLEVTHPVTSSAIVDIADDDTPASVEEAAPAEEADTAPRRRDPFI